MLSLLFKPKQRKAVFALMKEAKRRGVSVDELMDVLTPEELSEFIPPDKKERPVDVTKWGLPADDEVTTERFFSDLALAEADTAARSGDWAPAAELFAEIGADWDRRATVASWLGETAANDDTWLKTWQAARPGDPDAAVVHAEGLVRLAWQIRGGYRADETSREQFAGFFRVLEEAEDATKEAIELAPEDPTPWCTMLTLARGRQYEHERFRPLWTELMARAPLHHGGHIQALQYWCAKWGGSHELMYAFAEEAAAKSPSLAVMPLAAAHEAEIADAPAWKTKQVNAALDRLLPWLDGEGARHLSAREDRAYAALALVEAGRHTEAVEQFRKLGTHADGGVWAYYAVPKRKFLTTRYQACRHAARR
ncbi:DUF4034 domain-containing protein [Amycolatopsis sp. NPDC059027]|uniref:DUF4034 domain-containing protein n=1 Tax=unclassified Amycolatopsis TaxID=2618356 RepID=UPI0036712DBF